MALSYETYTSDGSTDNFAVPFDYIAKAHIFVKKNDVTEPFTWVSSSLINITDGVINGDVIEVRRTTPSTPLFNSSDGSVLTNSNLQTLGRQAIFLTQENQDRAEDTLDAAEEALEAANEAIDSTADDVIAAAASAAAALVSANSADTSEAAADASEAAALASQVAAAASATAAAGSATTATTQASSATSSASAAASSASAASGAATTATTQASNAATSATAAAGSATSAAASATTATTQAGDATTSAAAASSSASAAAASAAAVAAAFDAFDDRYLGAKSSEPTLDNDGNALVVGALYYDTVLGSMRAWDGAAWVSLTAGITQSGADLRYLQLTGGTLSGALTLPGSDPSNANHAARKAYVDAVRDLLFSTGDAKLTLKTTADTGWVMANDGTIGSASSGATTRANADTAALYAVLWAISDTYAPVTGGRGANAAADFAANKPIALTKVLGRALAVAGAGASLTSRALGQTLGAETHTLTVPEIPSHSHTTDASIAPFGGGVPFGAPGGSYPAGGATNGSTGGGGSHNNMQPTSFLNLMVKL